MGGLVGYNARSISNSYATGAVTGEYGVGGLVGSNNAGNISNSYSTGFVSGTGAIGGLVGTSTGTNVGSYWDTATSGQSHSDGGTGKTTQELQRPTGSNEIYADWDAEVWDFGTGSQYPVLKGVGPSVEAQRAGPTTSLPEATLGNPTNLRVVSVGDGQVTLEWEPASNANAHWLGWYKINSDGTETLVDVLQVSGTTSSATVTDLENGQPYSFVVFGSRGEQFSQESNRAQATPTAALPSGALGNPTNLRVDSVGDGQVKLRWQPAPSAEFHWIWSGQADGTAGRWTPAGGSAGSATVVGLASGSYHFAVLAGRTTGSLPEWSNWSNRVQATVTVVAAAASDRAALAGLYSATGGDNWTNNEGWLSEAPAGEWHGVSTDADGRVTSLELDSNNLTGTIPTEVGSLSSLTVLRLGGNQLTGAVPAQLSNLAKLTILGLGDNQLTGPVPSQLGNLSSLTRLSLWNNRLTGPIPAELGNLPQLEGMNLSANRLTGEIPSELGRLTHLEYLDVGTNQLSGEIPSQLANLTKLTRLSLSNNRLSGEIPLWLGDLSSLNELHLWRNQLSGNIPPVLGSLANLTELGLSDNRLSGGIPTELGNLSNLKLMLLHGNHLDGQIPTELGRLASLEVLDLGGNQLNGTIPAELGQLTNLTRLHLTDNHLDGGIPTGLGGLENLTHLLLGYNRLQGTIPSQLGNLTKLRVLTLENQNYFKGRAWADIGSVANLERQLNTETNFLHGSLPLQLQNLDDLTTLDLSNNRLTGYIPSGWGFQQNLSNLRYLDLSDNRFSGGVPATLGDLARLKSLSLRGNQLGPEVHPTSGAIISHGEIPEALGKLTELQSLDLSENALAGEIPQDLGSLSSLVSLDLSNNELEGAIPARLGGLSNLRVLDLSGNCLSGSIPEGLASLSDLRELNLSGNCLSGSIPSQLSTIDSLVVMDINDNPQLQVESTQVRQNEGGIAEDRKALVALYDATGGDDSWTHNANWKDDVPMSSWYGVSVATEHDPNRPKRTGRVIGLDLIENHLVGDINDVADAMLNVLDDDFQEDPNSPLFWLETLNLYIIDDANNDMTIEHVGRLLSILRQTSDVNIIVHQRQPDGTLQMATEPIIGTLTDASVDFDVLRSGIQRLEGIEEVADPIKKGRLATRVGAKVLTNRNAQGRVARVFLQRVAPAVAGGPFAPAIATVSAVDFAFGLETGECVGETFWLESPFVDQGPFLDASFSDCWPVLVNEVANAVSATADVAGGVYDFAGEVVTGAADLVGTGIEGAARGAWRVGSWFNPFG